MSAACRAATRWSRCWRSARAAAAFDGRVRSASCGRPSPTWCKRQVDIGIDVVSDGETSKISYATYVKDRLSGFAEEGSTEAAKPHLDLQPFPDLRAEDGAC